MQKLYYSISEVSKLVDEEQHILRYWEKEFPGIKPRKNRAGNRIYSQQDLRYIMTVKNLIRDEKLSLKGAKERMQNYIPAESNSSSPEAETEINIPKAPAVENVPAGLAREDLIALRNILKQSLDLIK